MTKVAQDHILFLKTTPKPPPLESVSKPFSFPSPSLGKLSYRLKSKGLASTKNLSLVKRHALVRRGLGGYQN